MCTTIAGKPTAASCICSNSSRTPCMLTRPNVSVTVVKAPTISKSPVRRASCKAQALSLPLDQAIKALGVSSSIVPVLPTALPRTCYRSVFFRLLERAQLSQRSFRCALARFPGTIHGAPLRLMQSFARQPKTAPNRLRQNSSRISTARHGGRHRAKREGLLVPARRITALDFVFDAGTKQRCHPVTREFDHRSFALFRQIAAENSGNLDQMQAAARDIGK